MPDRLGPRTRSGPCHRDRPAGALAPHHVKSSSSCHQPECRPPAPGGRARRTRGCVSTVTTVTVASLSAEAHDTRPIRVRGPRLTAATVRTPWHDLNCHACVCSSGFQVESSCFTACHWQCPAGPVTRAPHWQCQCRSGPSPGPGPSPPAPDGPSPVRVPVRACHDACVRVCVRSMSGGWLGGWVGVGMFRKSRPGGCCPAAPQRRWLPSRVENSMAAKQIDPSKDYYGILGLKYGVTPEEIKKTYKELALKSVFNVVIFCDTVCIN